MLTFLPIHAAGIYSRTSQRQDVDNVCLSDFCVTSYTLTLGQSIITSRPSARISRANTRILLAAAPSPAAHNGLPAASREIEVVAGIVPSHSILGNGGLPVPSAVQYASTADGVLRLLPETTILHLACHGKQNPSAPLESGFVMQDRMVHISDLLSLECTKARLAFLSACETAQGDLRNPDEILHLATAMLMVGFTSVVGTMWSMDDVDGPTIADAVYRELYTGEEDTLDLDSVPYALDAAVRTLRMQGCDVSRWATYIHVGT
jgi:CHAT domain-containing protein